MRFHCLLPVRDEADIIAACLHHALTWSDAIYVFDTGSVDNTWEIVQDIAAKDKRVKPLKKDPVFFSENRLRGWLFHQARQHMKSGDWFLRVDADEFHHIPPPEFVKSRLSRHETIVYHQYYNFALLQSEVAAWEAGRESLTDRSKPIESRRQWFLSSVYSEPRLCKYRESMQWPITVSFPYNAGYLARERLPIRHYPHRDPVQLERRCLLRAIMMADNENRSHWTEADLHHWAQSEWRKFITSDDETGLQRWMPGTKLPEVHYKNHISPIHKRIAQRVVHSIGLPILDRMRSKWNPANYPQKISESVIKELAEKLAK